MIYLSIHWGQRDSRVPTSNSLLYLLYLDLSVRQKVWLWPWACGGVLWLAWDQRAGVHQLQERLQQPRPHRLLLQQHPRHPRAVLLPARYDRRVFKSWTPLFISAFLGKLYWAESEICVGPRNSGKGSCKVNVKTHIIMSTFRYIIILTVWWWRTRNFQEEWSTHSSWSYKQISREVRIWVNSN